MLRRYSPSATFSIETSLTGFALITISFNSIMWQYLCGALQQFEGKTLKVALKTKLTEGGLKLAEARYLDIEKVEDDFKQTYLTPQIGKIIRR